MTFILTIFAFALMIFIHELGHFLAARAFGVGIETFSIGFGKPIKEWERRGVLWRLSWIPLGGYVKMKGEHDDSPDQQDEDSFLRKAWWKKALIGLSGPFANLLLGLLLFIFSFVLPVQIEDQRPVLSRAEGVWAEVFSPGDSIISVNDKLIKGFGEFWEELLEEPESNVILSREGREVTLRLNSKDIDSLAVSLWPLADTRVGEVMPKTPAYHAKLQPGDRITAVDSVRVDDWYEMREMIVNAPHDEILLEIQRGEQSLQKRLRLESSLSSGGNRTIGITQYQPVRYTRRFNLFEASKLGAYNTMNFVVLNYQMLGKLIRQPAELKKSVGGPVMIVSMSQQMGKRGLGNLLVFFGGISLMLMMMNLLPIPVLDGGLILFSILEGIFRRPIPTKVRAVLQSIGFFILMALMVLALYSDVTSEILRAINR
ncbi:MAG: RIP metalloprotease RseP [Candidatus Cloacimonadaceae bacterium]|nr:RIP metalloprotease RseP [Candidatus Cloacimonadota bacterium]MDX9949741.1 RIP metalloprotease RseP [Candidatus Syntrophosphaera sp.]